MTNTADISRRTDARALQARLYRELGVAAVAAALFPPARPDTTADQRPIAESPTSHPAPRRAA